MGVGPFFNDRVGPFFNDRATIEVSGRSVYAAREAAERSPFFGSLRARPHGTGARPGA